MPVNGALQLEACDRFNALSKIHGSTASPPVCGAKPKTALPPGTTFLAASWTGASSSTTSTRVVPGRVTAEDASERPVNQRVPAVPATLSEAAYLSRRVVVTPFDPVTVIVMSE